MVPIHERQTNGSNFRWVTELRLFHGGDTGSTPVRDANIFNQLQASRHFRARLRLVLRF